MLKHGGVPIEDDYGPYLGQVKTNLGARVVVFIMLSVQMRHKTENFIVSLMAALEILIKLRSTLPSE